MFTKPWSKSLSMKDPPTSRENKIKFPSINSKIKQKMTSAKGGKVKTMQKASEMRANLMREERNYKRSSN